MVKVNTYPQAFDFPYFNFTMQGNTFGQQPHHNTYQQTATNSSTQLQEPFTPEKETKLMKVVDSSSPFGLKKPKSPATSTNCFQNMHQSNQNVQGMIDFGNSPQMTKKDAENFSKIAPPSPETPLEDLI